MIDSAFMSAFGASGVPLMSRNTRIKAALLGLLLITILFNPSADPDRPRYWLLLFGIVNVLFDLPGTWIVRAIAIAATVLGLIWPGDLRALVALIAWLVWPPAFLVSWALAREPRDDNASSHARRGLAGLIAAVAVGSLAYRVIAAGGVQQTAALFIGIPALLAIVVVFAVSPRSATGVACKAVTIGLLVSLLFLGEGMLCVLMSAPIFYAVAIVIAKLMDSARRRRSHSSTTWTSCLIVVAAIPMSLEGVLPLTTVDREESVSQMRIVDASSQAIERAILTTPRFDRKLPLYLRAGFPRPIQTRIEQAANKTLWIVALRGGEMRINGMEPRTGDLVLVLEEARAGFMRWRAVSDSSHMTHFLTWREAVVEWEPITDNRSRITWTLRYRRGLDPAWYFGPWERYAAQLAAGHLIDSVATP